jgi:membrane-associated protease RseP (regulator of RpoE activity)
MTFTLGVVLFAFGIALSIALHEFGHLLTAKAFGMKATRYFIGFGPTLFSFRRGETEYGLKALPAGGFVKIVGMTRTETIDPADAPRAFWRFGAWKRTIVLAAGSVTHFLLAFLAIFLAAVTAGLPTDRPIIGEVTPCIVTVGETNGGVRECRPGDPAGPAAAAGLQKGDRIVSIGDQQTRTYNDVLTALRAHPGQTLSLTYVRNGAERSTRIAIAAVRRAPIRDEKAGPNGLTTVGGVGVAPSATESFGPVAAVGQSAKFVGQTVVGVFGALKSFPEKIPPLLDAVFGQQRDPNGPVSVVGVSRVGGQALEAGSLLIVALLFAGFNIFVGVFNLFPLLPLDGGHIAILWFERIRSRIAQRLGRRDPGPVDYNKLLPLTMLVIMVFGGISLLAIVADIVNPIANPFQ